MIAGFNLEEMQLVASDLDIDYENLPADTKQKFALELVRAANRQGKLFDLVHLMHKQRPNL